MEVVKLSLEKYSNSHDSTLPIPEVLAAQHSKGTLLPMASHLLARKEFWGNFRIFDPKVSFFDHMKSMKERLYRYLST
jgi:hypothetical protein